MKYGYIVWNNSAYGPEFFGVFRSLEQAERHYRKVVRNIFGKCPRGDYNKVSSWVIDHCDSNDFYIISEFNENIG